MKSQWFDKIEAYFSLAGNPVDGSRESEGRTPLHSHSGCKNHTRSGKRGWGIMPVDFYGPGIERAHITSACIPPTRAQVECYRHHCHRHHHSATSAGRRVCQDTVHAGICFPASTSHSGWIAINNAYHGSNRSNREHCKGGKSISTRQCRSNLK